MSVDKEIMLTKDNFVKQEDLNKQDKIKIINTIINDEKSKDYDYLQDNYNLLNNNYISLQEEHMSLKKLLAEYDDIIANLKKDKSDFEEKSKKLESFDELIKRHEVSVLLEEKKSLKEKVKQLEEKNKFLENNINNLHLENKTLTSERDVACHDSEQLNAFLEYLRTLIKDEISRKETLLSQKNALEVEYNKLQSEKDKLEKENFDLKHKNDDLKSLLNSLTEELDEVKIAKNTAEEEKNNAEIAKNNAESELRAKEKDLRDKLGEYEDIDKFYVSYKALYPDVKKACEAYFGAKNEIVSILYNVTKFTKFEAFFDYLFSKVNSNSLPKEQIDNLNNIFDILFKWEQFLNLKDGKSLLLRIETKIGDKFDASCMKKMSSVNNISVVKGVLLKGYKYNDSVRKQSLVC